MKTAYEQYQEMLAHLKAIQEKKDFTPEGEAEFLHALGQVMHAYANLYEEELGWMDSEGAPIQ